MDRGGRRDRSRSHERQRGEQQVEITVARRVYVGNLSYRTSWQDLKDHFGQVGTVRYADVLREGGPSGRSKGCGIVEFDTPEEAAEAILQLNETDLGGRAIFIREDREDFELKGEAGHGSRDRYDRAPPRRPFRSDDRGGDRGGGEGRVVRGGGGGGGGGGGSISIGPRVYVSNLAFSTSWQDVKDHFKQAGHVLHADILQDAEGNSRGAAIVEFERPQDALHAISVLSNSTLDGRQIHVREDREDPGTSLAGGRPRHREVSAPAGGGGGGSRGGPSAAPGTQIVVHGLPYRTSWQDLKDMCKLAGAVVRADIVTNPDGSSKGWGTVSFATPSDAAAAIQLLDGTTLEGRVVSAKLDKFV